MTNLEHVEKLRARANISYEEAIQVLNETNDDVLEALVRLEARGKTQPPGGGAAFSSNGQPGAQPNQGTANNYYYYTGRPPKQPKEKYDDSDGTTMSEGFGRIGRFFAKLFNKGNKNFIEIRRHQETLLQVPLTVFVLLLLFLFWVTVPLMIVGLFFNCRYVFKGSDVEKTGVNKAMNKAAEAVDSIKNEINDEVGSKKDSANQ